jgi:hypothetical protein
MYSHGLTVPSVVIVRMLGRIGVDNLLGRVHSLIASERGLPVLERAIEVPTSRSGGHVSVNWTVRFRHIRPASKALGSPHNRTLSSSTRHGSHCAQLPVPGALGAGWFGLPPRAVSPAFGWLPRPRSAVTAPCSPGGSPHGSQSGMFSAVIPDRDCQVQLPDSEEPVGRR